MPSVLLLGLPRTSVIVFAALVEDAFVIPPVILCLPHKKLLATLAERPIFTPMPSHVTAVGDVITAGKGLTVTVTRDEAPVHPPLLDVGVTLYIKVPMDELLGLVKWSVMVVPLPECPPDMVPAFATVQVKLLEVLDTNGIVSRSTLHTLLPPLLVSAGAGFTLTVTVDVVPRHEPTVDVGVTRY